MMEEKLDWSHLAQKPPSGTRYWRKNKGTESRGRRCNQLHEGNQRILENERRNTRSHSVENSVCKRLRTCRKTDCVMMMMMMTTTCGLCLENGHTEGKQCFGVFRSLQHSSGACILVVNAVAFRPISLLRRKSVLYFSLSSMQLGYCLTSPIVVLVDKLRVAQLFWKRVIYSSVSCSVHMRSVIYEWIWNTCGIILTGEKYKNVEKTLSQCCFAHYKFQMKWPGIELGSQRWEAGGRGGVTVWARYGLA